ncbi:hypothetical protein [Vitiosangium sp. GDMCC 1.1324]|uniref:hypothetical protein n=1 Tax=Vitiosangium sp. (strain GDMCC 1.1324) TaxID=2138576 RepID=UPI000D39AEC1|nr:hypothetical protein [Vitiosangium sp. GDMCC 1.1324]PTL81542.1 hypothetical protein DAT35_21505 [Vitiosangium sp. GDMCC 1.1324]
MRAVSMALVAICAVLGGCGGERGSEWVRADSKTTQTLESIHGSGPNDVWAVGRLGTLIHWDGTQWSGVDSGTNIDLHAVWAVGPKDAWAVGERGTVLHWDGTRWSRMALGIDNTLADVWASGPGDVWIVAGSGERFFYGPLHFDGKVWSERRFSDDSYDRPVHVWGSGPSDVWMIMGSSSKELMHWTGTGWTAVVPEVGSVPECLDAWGTGPSELWALCDMGFMEPVVLAKNASGWKLLPAIPSDDSLSFSSSLWNGLWGSGGKVWLVGDNGEVRHFDGSAWTQELRNDPDAPHLKAIWGSSESDLWAVGADGVVVRRTPPSSP